jgi:hypothetical protein
MAPSLPAEVPEVFATRTALLQADTRRQADLGQFPYIRP